MIENKDNFDGSADELLPKPMKQFKLYFNNYFISIVEAYCTNTQVTSDLTLLLNHSSWDRNGKQMIDKAP